MMKPAPFILPAALALLALGGCKKQADDAPKAAAGGELLPRSVGDDMLPYDTVKSQASLADPDAGLRLPRGAGPAVSASDVPEADTAGVVTDPVPVIEAPAPPPAQP